MTTLPDDLVSATAVRAWLEHLPWSTLIESARLDSGASVAGENVRAMVCRQFELFAKRAGIDLEEQQRRMQAWTRANER